MAGESDKITPFMLTVFRTFKTVIGDEFYNTLLIFLATCFGVDNLKALPGDFPLIGKISSISLVLAPCVS